MFIPFLEQFSYLQVRNQKQCQYLEEYSTHQEHQPQRSLDFSDFSSSAFRFLFPTRPPTVWSPALMPAAVRSLCIPALSISQTGTSSSWDIYYLLIQLNLEMRLICVCFGAFCNFSVHFLVGAWLIIGYSPWKLRKIKKMKLQFLNLKFEEKILLILENGMWQGERAFFFFKKNTVVYLLLCFVLLSLLMTTQKSFVLETFSSVLSSHLCKLVVLHIFSWSIKTFPENSKCGNPEYKLFRTWLAHSMHVTFHHLYVGSILALQTVVRALGIDLNQN